MKLLQLTLAGLLAVVLLSGCSDKPKLGKVTGTVTYKGTPLKEGSITFIPADGRSASGKIVEGKITEVTCFEVGDGAPVGSHKVIVQAVQGGPDMYAPAKSLIPDSYGSVEKSGLTAEIQPGETVVNFDLK